MFNRRDCGKVRHLVREQPDATLAEYCQRIADKEAAHVSLPTMCLVLDKLGLHQKKEPSCVGGGYGRVERVWRQFIREVAKVPADKLVSVDESGTTTSKTRLWRRGPKG